MKFILILMFLLISKVAGAQAVAARGGGSGGGGGRYNVIASLQVGYPFVGIENPDGGKAYYDGLGLRCNLNIPIIDLSDTDVYLTAGVKYLDLENTANSSAQYESANMVGPGAGLTIKYTKFLIGAQYYQMWARHFSTGEFSSRSKYSFGTIDSFVGLNQQFGRLGVSLIYSLSSATIDKTNTGLTVDTPYSDSMVSIQFTFDIGQTFWKTVSELF